jgi:UDP-2,4-diacetamido-2,4,6-trideoxy-beta-L-altropyranose hydrolase
METKALRHPGTLVLRCDASVAMGTGHVMRCVALAQAWQDAGGDAVFVMAESTPATQERLDAEKCAVAILQAASGSLEDAEEVAKLAQSRSARWVVVDGYGFNHHYQQALKQQGLKLLLIHDGAGFDRLFADLVLNQNACARKGLYERCKTGTRLLLGPRYAPLRREFTSRRDSQREIPPLATRLLVTMGGSDPDNVTLNVLHALSLLKQDLEIAVVVGGSNPHRTSLEDGAKKLGERVRLLQNPAMPELMSWADLAISGAGTTTAELCFLGVPAVLVDIAPNQTPVAEELSRLGAAVHWSPGKAAQPEKLARLVQDILDSREQRAALSKAARILVDDRGAQRVTAAIRGHDLQLRRAEPQDSRVLWEWANEPAARAASFSQDAIPWDRHVEWFAARLRDESSRIYIASEADQEPVGAVRFQLENSRAVVSISVAPGARGQGLGWGMLSLASECLFQSTPAAVVDAYVKPENAASLRLFEKAGFQRRPEFETIRGQRAAHFVLSRNGI